MIVAARRRSAFVSPACERTLGLKPEEITGKSLPDLWVGEDGEKVRMFLAEVAAARSGTVGPVELRIERGARRCVIEASQQSDGRSSGTGVALNFRDISERKALEEQLGSWLSTIHSRCCK